MKTYTLADARRDHRKWFAPDATRFFGTRVHEERRAGSAVYVVTSEQPPYGARTWNVRRFTADDSDTIGPDISEGHGSHARALEVASLLASAERRGALQERADRHDRFEPCATCRSEGKEYPSWAQFTYECPGEDERFPVCGTHVAAVVKFGEG
jgi:hypothetical protein